MIVADIVTRNIISVSPDASVEEAIKLMLANRISGLPVVNAAGEVVGVVTEGDFLRRTETGTVRHRPRWLELLLGPGKLAEEYVTSHTRKVKDVMTDKVIGIEESADLGAAVELMERHRIKRLPVFRQGKLCGIVSRASLLQALVAIAKQVPAAPGAAADAAIREAVLAEIGKEAWAPRAGINVVVQDGIAHLWGVIMDERERSACRVLAENVPGVKKVVDHLVWVEPMSGFALGPDEIPR